MARGPVLALLAGASLFGACGEDEGAERKLFLKRMEDYAGSPEHEKGRRLHALRILAPRTHEVREAQQTCLSAYGGIERAESEHARAKRLLADVEAGRRALDATGADIQRAIAASNQAVDGARGHLDRCTQLVDRLRLAEP